jgi:hypothetical protein
VRDLAILPAGDRVVQDVEALAGSGNEAEARKAGSDPVCVPVSRAIVVIQSPEPMVCTEGSPARAHRCRLSASSVAGLQFALDHR